MPHSPQQQISAYFRSVELRLRLLAALGDVLLALLALSVAGLVGVLTAWLLPLGPGFCRCSAAILVGILVLAAAKSAWWLARPRLTREEVAEFWEAQLPEHGQLLRTAQGLAEQPLGSPGSFTEAILTQAAALLPEAMRRLSYLPQFPVLPFRLSMGALGVLLLVGGLALPDYALYFWRGLHGNLPGIADSAAPRVQFQLPPRALPPGEPVQLRFAVWGEPTSPPQVLWREQGQTTERSQVARATGQQRQPGAGSGSRRFPGWAEHGRRLAASTQWAVTLRDVQESFTFRVQLGEWHSREWLVRVQHPPRVAALALAVTPPAYLGQPAVTFEPLPLSVKVHEGSALRLSGRISATEELATLAVLWLGSGLEPLPLPYNPVEGGWAFTADLNLPLLGERLSFQLIGESREGQALDAGTPQLIEVIPDTAPEVRFTRPGKDVTLDSEMSVPLTIEAEDNRGLTRLSLFAYHERLNREERIGTWTFERPQPFVRQEATLDLTRWDILPEDAVTYFAVAWDDCGIPQRLSDPGLEARISALDVFGTSGKSGRSSSYQVRFPSLDEMYEAMTGDDGFAETDLGEVLSQQTQLLEQSKEMVQELRATQERGERSDPQDQRYEEMLRKQEELLDKGKQAVEQMQQDLERLTEEDLVSTQIAQKVQELQHLLQEVVNRDMAEAMQRLQEMAQNMDIPDEMREQMLQEMTATRMLEDLQRAVENLQALKQQMKMDATGQALERLAEKQRELAESAELASWLPEGEERQAAEERITAEQAKLQQEISKMEEKLREMAAETSDPDLKAELEEMADQLGSEDLQQDMAEAKKELAQKNLEKAAQAQQKAADKMQAAADKLRQQQQEMFTDEYSAAIDELQRLFHQGAFQARQLKTVLQGVGGIRYDELKASPRYQDRVSNFAGRVRLVQDSLNMMLTRLNEMAAQSPYLDPAIQRHLGEARLALDGWLGSLGDQGMVSRSPDLRTGLGWLNQALLAMMDSQDVLQEMADMMSMEEMMQDLGQLSREQRSLNQQTRRMRQQSQQGMPIPMPSAQQMAMQQSLMAERLGQLQRQAQGKPGPGGEKREQGKGEFSDELDQLGQEMREVSEELAKGEVTDELLDRQERLYYRMLDAQKALKKQGYKRERQARRPDGDEVARQPKPLAPELTTPSAIDSGEMLLRGDEHVPAEYRDLIKAFHRALGREQGKGERDKGKE